jgi:hypothetical protein
LRKAHRRLWFWRTKKATRSMPFAVRGVELFISLRLRRAESKNANPKPPSSPSKRLPKKVGRY